MTTETYALYNEGGFDPNKPDSNVLLVTEQDFDADGNPVGDPRQVFPAP